MQPILIIPSRLASTRLPHKPLHLIAEKPLIAHVYERARAAFDGRIVVACCNTRVIALVKSLGGEAVLTDPDLPSGTDRVFAAYKQIAGQNTTNDDIIINLQGDMAIFPKDLIQHTLAVFKNVPTDIATAVCRIPVADVADPSTVKVAFEASEDSIFGKALYFSRAVIPYGAKQFFKHIGIYAYTKKSLIDFVASGVGHLEDIEKLENLRGLSLGQRFGAAIVDGDYFSVDTLHDVKKVEEYLSVT